MPCPKATASSAIRSLYKESVDGRSKCDYSAFTAWATVAERPSLPVQDHDAVDSRCTAKYHSGNSPLLTVCTDLGGRRKSFPLISSCCSFGPPSRSVFMTSQAGLSCPLNLRRNLFGCTVAAKSSAPSFPCHVGEDVYSSRSGHSLASFLKRTPGGLLTPICCLYIERPWRECHHQ